MPALLLTEEGPHATVKEALALRVEGFLFAQQLQAAREQLDQAEALFREIDMDWWSEQAEGLRGRIDRGEEFFWFAPYVDGPPTT